MLRRLITSVLLLTVSLYPVLAQELHCTVKINHSQIQGTNTSVFETLETTLNEFMNNRSWTDLQFQKDERIECTLSLMVKKYTEAENRFETDMLLQVSRPVYNSSYNSTIFSMRDNNFHFTYKEYDPLEFNENNIDNNLTAVLAYYAYLFIGMDLDTMSPLGGTDVLHMVESITNSAQSLGEPGWKAFDDSRNRHAIITDYMETSLEPLRQFQYTYHRKGLDEMANNTDRGRVAITEAIELLRDAHSNRPISQLPQIFADFKRDEIVSIYMGHGTEKEKNTVHDILSNISTAQNTYWAKIRK